MTTFEIISLTFGSGVFILCICIFIFKWLDICQWMDKSNYFNSNERDRNLFSLAKKFDENKSVDFSNCKKGMNYSK